LIVEIDYGAHTVAFHAPADFHPGTEGTTIPLAMKRGLIYVPLDLTGEHHPSLHVEAILDTGMMDGGVNASASALSEDDFASFVSRVFPGRAIGGGGWGLVQEGRMPSLSIAGCAVPKPLLQHVPEGLAGPPSNWSVGQDVLRNFKLTIDYPGRKLTLVPGKNFGEVKKQYWWG